MGGSATWQLSRYALGLNPRFDRAVNSFDLTLHVGSLDRASGKIPLPSGAVVGVDWTLKDGTVYYTVTAPDEAVEIFTGQGKKKVQVKANTSRTLELPAVSSR